MRLCVIVTILVILQVSGVYGLAAERNQETYLGGNTTDISAAANAISESLIDKDYLQYRDKVGKFSIIYPKGAVVTASGDEKRTETDFSTPTNVTILKVSTALENRTLDKIMSQVENKISHLPNVTVIDATNSTINASPVRQIKFTWTDKTGLLFRTKQLFTLYNDRLLVITVQLPDKLFAENYQIMDKMLQSFTFIPVSNKPQGWYLTQYGWIWYPDAADLARWNWDHYSGNNYFSSTDYWGTGMDWLDVSNARWDWYMNSDD